MKYKKIMILFLFIHIIFFGAAQVNVTKTTDSLEGKSIEYLQKNYTQYSNNGKKASIYAYAYLKKAKKLKDSFHIMAAYYLLSASEVHKKAIKYSDSAIYYLNEKKYEHFKTTIYSERGNRYYNVGNDGAALDDYLLAKKSLNQEKNPHSFSIIEYNIGLIMTRTGQYPEALKMYKKRYNYILKNRNEIESADYLYVLLSLSNTYRYNKKLDSALYYSKLGIQEAYKKESRSQYSKAKITEGTVNYELKNYRAAVDSILKYIPLMEQDGDSLDFPIARFFLGKSYMQLNDWDNALIQFKKVDTLTQKTNYHPLELRENYNLLYTYYKEHNNLENQLHYLEKLIDFDSILYSNNTYIQNTLLKKYETPKLIQEKEFLIKKINKASTSKSRKLQILLLLFICLLILTYYYNRKRILYKKRFKTLLQDKKTSEKKIDSQQGKKNLNIPKSIIEGVLKKIDEFEKSNQFLNSSISLNTLAKNMGTNSNYLSKIINFYKNKNFSNYLTDLRIDYAIEALKTQSKLRDYTIKAISFEVGFKNVESFTKAFYRKTGIYPSYFIKNLKTNN